MPAPTPLEHRLQRLETRMTALEQLPERMERMEIQLDNARREMRVLYEDVLGRIAVIGDGLITLSERVDYQFDQLTGLIDASRTELRETLAQILTRLDSPRKKKNR